MISYEVYADAGASHSAYYAAAPQQSAVTDQGPDYRRVVKLRDAAVRTKEKLSNSCKFVVCNCQFVALISSGRIIEES